MGVGLSPVGEGGCADNALVAAYCVTHEQDTKFGG